MRSWKRSRRRAWALSATALLIATGVAIVAWREATGLLSRKQASGRPSRSAAGVLSADEPRAARSRASEAIGAGRFDEAFEIYRRLDDGHWDADLCFALGSALQRRDRIVLPWAAFEAARRIDPKNAQALRAIEEIQAKMARASEQERTRLHEAATRVKLLFTVPGGPPLGLLVLGLARFASDAGQEEEFLDRLGVRDREVLRGVNSIMTASLLVARLLLETGRPAEAYDLLDALVSHRVAHAELALNAPTSEAAWLLSRAALQLDRHQIADAMLVLAGDVGKRPGLSPEPAPFVGSKRCGECHRQIYHEQQHQSRHALTLRFGATLKEVPLPAHPVPDPFVPGITHTFTRKGDDRIELESRDGDKLIQAIVQYAVGSGRHGITMVARDPQGIARELRVSYFAANQSWGETKGVKASPRDAGEHIGLGLSSTSLRHCLQCHTTWFRSLDQARFGLPGPEGQDRGIGCERCHGPGLSHVKAALSGYAETAIALTSNAPSAVRLKSCVECHAADGSIEPSDPEFTRAQGTTFLFSRCFTASKDRFGCTTCHDPHRPVDTALQHYEAKCLGCHGATSPLPGRPSSSKVDDETARPRAPSCPMNATGGCISCHMPKVEDTSRRSRFTDHHIRVHGTEAAVHARVPRRKTPNSARPGSPRLLSDVAGSAMIEEKQDPS